MRARRRILSGAQQHDRAGRRSPGEGRLHAEPPAPDDLWRRDELYSREGQPAGVHVELSAGAITRVIANKPTDWRQG